MSHKDAPSLTAEQQRFEQFYRIYAPPGSQIGFGRGKDGTYHAEYARLAWRAWNEAQKGMMQMIEISDPTTWIEGKRL